MLVQRMFLETSNYIQLRVYIYTRVYCIEVGHGMLDNFLVNDIGMRITDNQTIRHDVRPTENGFDVSALV